MASMVTTAATLADAGAGGAGTDAASKRAVGIVWYKQSDLRVSDHEPLLMAHQECAQVAHVFCLDMRWFGQTK